MNQISRIINRVLILAIVCVAALFTASATGQDIKATLFKDADTAMKAANAVHADVLSPQNFGEAMKRYRKAESDLQKGEELEDIRRNLSEAVAYFNKAIEATRLADVTFPNAMKARRDALATDAPRHSAKLWKEAEEKFNDAAGQLEDGDLNDARKKAGEAEKRYRQAELDAIKANYLDPTRALLKTADDMDVKDRAPRTLQLAQQLVKQAEKELNENRYDTDVARGLAMQANYQAKHAIYLSKAIKQMKDKDMSWEDLMLASEQPLIRIAETSSLVPAFDSGTDQTTNQIVAAITTNQEQVRHLSQEVSAYRTDAQLKEARIAEMEKQFGSQAQETSALSQQIANQAKARAIFAKLENSFSPAEAQVLREEDDIILRLSGLTFPSGKSTIEPQAFALLTKVRDAIKAFPEATVTVLGNTDSYGGDAQNLQLSTERAEAVKQYLLANTTLSATRIDVVGYGESKPIATNETATGRAANRRVEVVIHPWAAVKMIGRVD